MAPATSTVKPSKACANISRGKQREQRLSRSFHLHGVPVLVAAQVLRSRGLGQCDLVRFLPRVGLIEIVEVKGAVGAHRHQWQRLKGAGEFLGALLGASVRINLHREFANDANLH